MSPSLCNATSTGISGPLNNQDVNALKDILKIYVIVKFAKKGVLFGFR
jgi:hypothetical protein